MHVWTGNHHEMLYNTYLYIQIDRLITKRVIHRVLLSLSGGSQVSSYLDVHG